MNDEQKELARRLAAHPKFEWRPGMLALEDPPSGNWQPGDDQWRVITGAHDLSAVTSEGDVHEAPYMPSAFARAVPDLTDAATGGVLLEMLGDGWLAVRARGWGVHKPGSPINPPRHHGETLTEACARALLAEWGEP